MSFNRNIMPAYIPSQGELTAMMVGVGMNLASKTIPNANIEDTLFFVSQDGFQKGDLRALSLLTAWLDIHFRRINADRLVRLVLSADSEMVKTFWIAFAHWKQKDRRFAKLLKLWDGSRRNLLQGGIKFRIQRYGEDPRFAKGPLRAPNGVLRTRSGDILSPDDLVVRHAAYRWRILVGPTYRADMLALLENDASLSAAEIARRTYGSFATAHDAKRDWGTLQFTRNSANHFSGFSNNSLTTAT